MSKKPTERGAELRQLREECGMTRAQWADALGVSRISAWRYEAGEQNVSEPVLRLARRVAEDHRQRKGEQ